MLETTTPAQHLPKSALHCLRGFGFKHLLEVFAWKLHEEEVCGSESAEHPDLIPSTGEAWSELSCLAQPWMLQLMLSADFRLLMISAAHGCWDWGTALCTVPCTVSSTVPEGNKICAIMLHVCWHVSIHPNTFWICWLIWRCLREKNSGRFNIPKYFVQLVGEERRKILLRERLQHQFSSWTDKGEGCYECPANWKLFRQNSWSAWQQSSQPRDKSTEIRLD